MTITCLSYNNGIVTYKQYIQFKIELVIVYSIYWRLLVEFSCDLYLVYYLLQLKTQSIKLTKDFYIRLIQENLIKFLI